VAGSGVMANDLAKVRVAGSNPVVRSMGHRQKWLNYIDKTGVVRLSSLPFVCVTVSCRPIALQRDRIDALSQIVANAPVFFGLLTRR
ncbi:MAG TPA: hypothetical protein VMU99_05505, partial [Acidimicrobiales bacterium]|nr:hypothetical protein [Acidimicrobiales bacterium]